MGAAPVQSSPISSAMEVAVRAALAEVMASPEFRASQKCQSFLIYVVDATLAGRQESLKERVIGAEVFGRAPGFETAGDSIVRVKATEVRRRLAKYYQNRQEDPVRIELPTGSYVPVFHWEELAESPVVPLPPVSTEAIRPAPSRRIVIGCLGAVAVGAAAWKMAPVHSPLDEFWAPLVTAPAPIVVCTSGGPALSVKNNNLLEVLRRGSAPGTTIRVDELALSRQAQTSWPTVHAIVDVSRLLAVAGKEFQVHVADELSFEQVRHQPLVVIGMFSNPWTIALTQNLRFSFEAIDNGSAYLVKDAANPGASREVHGLYPHSRMPVDYALVTRLLDPQQDRRVIAIGGISGLGTRVAADFATNQRNWEQFAQIAPAGWERKNVQVLLETRVIGDTPSPPTIVATHVW